MTTNTGNSTHVYYPEPPLSQFLFASRFMAPFWTVVRVYLGWLWLTAGWGKINNPVWVGESAGVAVTGFFNGALTKPDVPVWYAWMLEHIFLPMAPTVSYVVAFGEFLVGLALIVGFATGFMAFLGGLMNVAFMLAGTLSTNPVMFLLATWLVLAWRIAGYYGLDYWLLPLVGAPHGIFNRQRNNT